MKQFYLIREDLLQTDYIAEGVEFSDGTVVIHWLIFPYSTSFYRTIEEIRQDITSWKIDLYVEDREEYDGQYKTKYHLESLSDRKQERHGNSNRELPDEGEKDALPSLNIRQMPC